MPCGWVLLAMSHNLTPKRNFTKKKNMVFRKSEACGEISLYFTIIHPDHLFWGKSHGNHSASKNNSGNFSVARFARHVHGQAALVMSGLGVLQGRQQGELLALQGRLRGVQDQLSGLVLEMGVIPSQGTNSHFAPENRPGPKRKLLVVFQPSIFSSYVSFRAGTLQGTNITYRTCSGSSEHHRLKLVPATIVRSGRGTKFAKWIYIPYSSITWLSNLTDQPI